MAHKVFIPIKEESQRVPKKNFRAFGGKPLWKHTLDKLTDYDVYVNTDSESIIKQIKETYTNVTPIKRMQCHIGNEVPVNWMLGYFANECHEDDIVAQVHVTSPFLKVETLDKIFNMFKGGGVDSVATVDVIQARCWRTEAPKRFIPINHDPEILEQTQDINPIYVENSLIYAFEVGHFLNTRNRFSGAHKLFYETSFPENLDIDTEADWDICKKLARLNHE